jgi:hypothetical protein
MKNQIQIQTEASRNAIALRAYHLWERAGRPSGRDLEHWLQAEAELNAASQREILKFVSTGADTKSKPVRAAAPSIPGNHIVRTTGPMTESASIEGSRKERSRKSMQPQL